jgi:flagellar biosynthesis/type III secretory pathway protein FliH
MNLQARQNENRLFKEIVMNLSPVYDQWREKTVAEGREQGIPLGQLELLKRQLAAKFDRLSPQTLEPLDRLNSEQLSELAIALLSFGERADLDRWLQANGV